MSLAVALLATTALALSPQEPLSPPVQPASAEAAQQIRKFEVPAGFTIDLVAAEPMLANPVAFHVDPRGRFFVAETFRIKRGVFDMRDHMPWLEADLGARTVADRAAWTARRWPDAAKDFGPFDDLVRRLVDRDGDGRVDEMTVFADGFSAPLQGIGSGILGLRDEVLYACIPDLWRLRDDDDDGVADRREKVSTGYGVHFSLIGHDLHGLIVGPDRRLYFSVGDRGAHVVTREGRTLSVPDTGAVFRCELDGSGLELFATGLRNPQELAFDRHGLLFTGDNNSDSADLARWVHVAEGSDSGWRIGYQWLDSRGPWNRERLWHLADERQPAYLLPPIAHVGAGPAGLAFHPGTGLPPRFADTFFLCDFRGSAAISRVHALRHQPLGAGFELTHRSSFVGGMLCTDVAFGSLPGLYVSDWVAGWNGTGKGRIYRVHAADPATNAAAADTARLLREGMANRTSGALLALLDHRDLRIRQEAQFALTDLPEPPLDEIAALAAAPDRRDARVHAAFALAGIARRNPTALTRLAPLLDDAESDMRALGCRLLGDADVAWLEAPARERILTTLRARLKDQNARVRADAATACGKLRDRAAGLGLLDLLRREAGRDPALRHAAIHGLVRLRDTELLASAAADPSPAVRVGVVVALRRLGSDVTPLTRFLADAEPFVVAETARAILDEPFPAGFPVLAALLDAGNSALLDHGSIGERAIDAAFRLGDDAQAARLVAFARRDDASADLRAFALRLLADFAAPPPRSRLTGALAHPAERTPDAARAALGEASLALVRDASSIVRRAAAEAIAELGVVAAAVDVEALVTNDADAGVRSAALRALAALQIPSLPAIAARAARDGDADVRRTALAVLAAATPAAAVPAIAAVLEVGTVREQQDALAALGRNGEPAADALLAAKLDALLAGTLPVELHLDVVEAATRRDTPELRALLRRREATLPHGDRLAPFALAMHGGDARRGSKLFHESQVALCLKCHAVNGYGGDAGPDLGGVGARLSRTQLLESLVDPGATLTPGFASIVVTRHDGTSEAGFVVDDTAERVAIRTADGRVVTFARSTIRDVSKPQSSMPPMGLALSRPELRDLIEFLATRTEVRPR